eukprot:2345252-Lingulodinium_polyedra.AAC.1
MDLCNPPLSLLLLFAATYGVLTSVKPDSALFLLRSVFVYGVPAFLIRDVAAVDTWHVVF